MLPPSSQQSLRPTDQLAPRERQTFRQKETDRRARRECLLIVGLCWAGSFTSNTKRIMKRTLAELTVAEHVPELVSTRTVDAAQGYEADIGVLDCTRTRHTGFTKGIFLGAVATTRARYGLIIVGSSPAFEGELAEHWIKGSLNHCLDRGAVQHFGKDSWTNECQFCYQTYKPKQKSCGELTCLNCGESHHTRNCKRPAQPMSATVVRDTNAKMPGWSYGERIDTKFSRNVRKTLKEARGDEDIPTRTSTGRVNLDLRTPAQGRRGQGCYSARCRIRLYIHTV
ncbi:hypothetical protein F5Y10DRAFT_232562 [Nemania abortiva]|nr:hypothetical protein F5Y10DRAFT_232562 [Nemania abortiva]